MSPSRSYRSRRLLAIAGLLALLGSLLGSVPGAFSTATTWQDKVDPWVLQTAVQGQTEFLVFLAEQADLSAAERLTTKQAKGQFVYDTLTAAAQRTQGPVLQALKSLGAEHRAYWVANMVWVRAGPAVIEAMARRADVAHVYANPKVTVDDPVEGLQPDLVESPDAVEWNILKVNADDVWAAGYTGQGAVVGGQDTGYHYTHPALLLKYRGWNGSTANHNYNWHDAIHTGTTDCGINSPQPCDDHWHGTHTMGTMVGNDGGANQVGMAPGAKWIGCRNMAEGNGTPATYAECYQWFIAPTDLSNQNPLPSMAPDVINNSWGCPFSEGCTDANVLLTVVNSVRAAGILTAHSAGNSGSSCSTVNEPAAIYASSFSVGATTSADAIASFSSRGPVTIDGSNRLKPDISAPGASVRSSIPNAGYSSSSGTSMAAPHVAGLTALLISANPELAGQVNLLEEIIKQSAVKLVDTYPDKCGLPAGAIPNYTFGYGRIDAWAAYQLLPELELQGQAPAQAAPGGQITYTFTVTNPHPFVTQNSVSLVDTLPANTTFTSATGAYTVANGQVTWNLGSLTPGEVNIRQLVVTITPGASGSITNDAYTTDGSLAKPVSGGALVTGVALHGLELSKSAPAFAAPGEVLTYTLVLTSTSASQVQTNLVLTDTLPAHTSFVSATQPYQVNGSTVQWDFSNLGAGQSTSAQLVVQIDPGYIGTITNSDYGAASSEAVAAPPVPVLTRVWLVTYVPVFLR